jgi:hypothetical protein
MFDRIPSYFHSNISLFILIIIGLIAGLFAYYQYRRTIPPISQSWQVVLAVLRTSSVASILLLFFAPEITAIWQSEEKRELAVLIDRSASMGITEGGNTRLNKAVAAARKIVESIKDQVDVTLYAFEMDTVKLNTLDVDTSSLGTNIENSLDAVIKSSTKIKDLILISDGNYTAGSNPIYLNRLNDVRVFCIGVGDTVDLPDLLVEDVKTNQIVYQNQPTEIKAYFVARGIDNQRAQVRLMHGRNILQAKEIQLGKRGETHITEFQLMPKLEGIVQYKIEIQALPNETIVRNNSYTISLDILKGKVRVGLLSTYPGNENKFLKFILSKLNEVELRSSVYKKGNQYYLNRPEKIMDSLDVLILDNYPSSGTNISGFDNAIKKAVRSNTPILVVISKFPSGPGLNLLRSIFPVGIVKKYQTPVETQPQLPLSEKSMPLLSVFETEDEANKFWSRIPPIRYEIQDIKFERPVTNLLEKKVKNNSIDQNQPIIVAYDGRNLKSILMLGSGFWRWHFLLAEDQVYHDSWQIMIKNMIRWLDSKASNKNVIISSPDKSYEVGQKISLTMQVYDGAFNPVGDALIITKISSPSSTFEIESEVVQDGNYEGYFVPMTSGKYLIEAEAWRNDVNLGKDQIELAVLPVNQEFTEIKQNTFLLNKLAARTGGLFMQIDQQDDLLNHLNLKSELKAEKETIELWNRWPMLIIIIILLGAEWFIRKRKGLA